MANPRLCILACSLVVITQILYPASASSFETCSPTECHSVDCAPVSRNCPSGQVYVEHAVACGCCPSCVRQAENYGPCVVTTPWTASHTGSYNWIQVDDVCAPGFHCVVNNGISTCVNEPCETVRARAQFAPPGQNVFIPSCDKGRYKEVQCHGNMCYCSGINGRRIGEYSSPNPHDCRACRCAIAQYHMGIYSQEASALRCSGNGGFEKYQCRNGVCWCTNYKGIPNGDTTYNTAAEATSQCADNSCSN